ncbi:MAG: winged helix-turn-helix transcriptional regulator [Nitrososphaerota archaeon]|nr:winged helix-turn-helix transcriptional regulator [Nitrososphaerota archaeon]
MGVIQYHLHTLETDRRILSQRRGLYKRFYLNLVFGENQREILSVLSQESERDLLLHLVKNPNVTQKELCEYSRISAGTINWHMKRLGNSGLVSSTRDGQFVRYKVSVDTYEILKLLQSYHPTIWEKWADRFANVVDEISSSKGQEPENNGEERLS